MKRLSVCSFLFICISLFAQTKPSNHQIATQALAYNGGYGNQCKIFLQSVLADLQYPVGPGYRSSYLNIGYEITEQEALEGDVIQIYNDLAIVDDLYYSGYHTSIVLKNNGDGTLLCIDSNWGLDEMVQIHTWDPGEYAINNSTSEYTLTAHYYRLGTVIGMHPNGWHTDGTSQAILNRYKLAQANNHSLGQANDNGGTKYVHEWYGLWLQDFYGNNTGFYDGHTVLILNSAGSEAFLLKEGFRDMYLNLPDKTNGQYFAPTSLGAPTTDEVLTDPSGTVDGNTYQYFDHGYLKYIPDTDSSIPGVVEVWIHNFKVASSVSMVSIAGTTTPPASSSALSIATWSVPATIVENQSQPLSLTLRNLGNEAVTYDNIRVRIYDPNNDIEFFQWDNQTVNGNGVWSQTFSFIPDQIGTHTIRVFGTINNTPAQIGAIAPTTQFSQFDCVIDTLEDSFNPDVLEIVNVTMPANLYGVEDNVPITIPAVYQATIQSIASTTTTQRFYVKVVDNSGTVVQDTWYDPVSILANETTTLTDTITLLTGHGAHYVKLYASDHINNGITLLSVAPTNPNPGNTNPRYFQLVGSPNAADSVTAHIAIPSLYSGQARWADSADPFDCDSVVVGSSVYVHFNITKQAHDPVILPVPRVWMMACDSTCTTTNHTNDRVVTQLSPLWNFLELNNASGSTTSYSTNAYSIPTVSGTYRFVIAAAGTFLHENNGTDATRTVVVLDEFPTAPSLSAHPTLTNGLYSYWSLDAAIGSNSVQTDQSGTYDLVSSDVSSMSTVAGILDHAVAFVPTTTTATSGIIAQNTQSSHYNDLDGSYYQTFQVNTACIVTAVSIKTRSFDGSTIKLSIADNTGQQLDYWQGTLQANSWNDCSLTQQTIVLQPNTTYRMYHKLIAWGGGATQYYVNVNDVYGQGGYSRGGYAESVFKIWGTTVPASLQYQHPTVSVTPLADFTIATWCNFAAPVSTSGMTLLTYGDQVAVKLQLNNTIPAVVLFMIDHQGNTHQVSYPWSTLDLNTWHHLVVTRSQATGAVTLQIDGEHQGTLQSTNVSLYTPTQQLYLGSHQGNNAMTGALDEVGIWHRVLTSSEQLDLYNTGQGLPYGNSSSGGMTKTIAVPPLTTDSVSTTMALLPSTVALQQNYPNPFNPTTTIGFDIPQETHVQIRIFNILGEQVALLVDQQLQPGQYHVDWDASSHAAGVYFYALGTSTGEHLVRKLIVLK